MKRFTHPMVRVFAVGGALGLVLLGARPGSAQHTTGKPQPAQKSPHHTIAKAQYECKMDGILMIKGGKCPKCGMAMTKMGNMSHMEKSKKG